MSDIVKWEPFKDFVRLFEEMDKMFAPFIKAISQEFDSPHFMADIMDLEVNEEGGEVLITGNIPGAAKDNLNVVLHQDKVIVSGEVATTTDRNGRTEYQWSKFTRAFGLPTRIKSEKATVNVQDGRLKIRAPKE